VKTLQDFGNERFPAGVQLMQADDPVTVGGHRLAGRLKSSGTAVVYLAHDADAGLVTIKTVRAATAEAPRVRDRLKREAACARRLPSFCTARLIHDGTDQTPPYLVREHLEGPSLEQVVETGGPLVPDDVRTLAGELARALAAVHDADVVHGNLLPASVIITKNGVGVIDFGVAPTISTSAAEIGAAADNPGWLAPELLTGGPPGPACDVFGWGCLVGYAATGHSPYDPDVHLDEPLRDLVQAALNENPAARPTADDLVTLLAAPPPAGDAAREPARWRGAKHRATPVTGAGWRPGLTRAVAGISALVALAAALLMTVPSGIQPNPAHPAHPPSRPPAQQAPPHHPRTTGRPNTSAITALADPPTTARRTRAPRRAAPPEKNLQLSCTGVPSRWCSRSAIDAWEHLTGWRVTWTATR
jgi:hypothetical protein